MTAPATYYLAPLSSERKLRILAIPLGFLLLLVLSALYRWPRHAADPAWLTSVAPFLVLLSFGFFFIYRRVFKILASTRLELDDEQFRHVTLQRILTLSWSQIRLLQIQKDEMNRAKTITLRAETGMTLILADFEKMPEIAASITAHCKSLRASTSFERAMFSSQFKWLAWAYFIGVIAFMFYVSPDQMKLEIGSSLLALGYVPYAWLYRGNLSGAASSTGFWKSAFGTFVKRLLLWIVIVIVVLLILNFFVAKSH